MLDIYTLDGDDETVKQLMVLVNIGLPIVDEGEMMSPENISALRAWVRAENFRLTPRSTSRSHKRDADYQAQQPVYAHPIERYRTSPHYKFWTSLKPGQLVRWTGTKAQTYFVVTGTIVEDDPNQFQQYKCWVQLRRHTGLTFWAHISSVRELD